MNNEIRTGDTSENVFIYRKVAPIKSDMGIIYIRSEFVSVFLAVTVE